MPSLLDAWSETLIADLRAFADCGSEPKVETDGNTLRAAWRVRSEERDALFSLKSGDRIKHEGPWKSIEQVELATLEWVDWYNNSMIHGACERSSPASYYITTRGKCSQKPPSNRCI